MGILIARCSRQAAEYAVLNWHYSQRMPRGKLVHYGVWEDEVFKGAVVYGVGATREVPGSIGLGNQQACELVRVALTRHTVPVSQVIAATLSMIKKDCPGLRAVVSYADSSRHAGKIYQAGNWIYLGVSARHVEYKAHGSVVHGRALSHVINATADSKVSSRLDFIRAHIDPNAQAVERTRKYKYVYPLDAPTRRRLLKQALPYPKGVSSCS